MQRLAQHPRCVAIGETGLDYYREHAPHEDQARAFKAQIEIAREVGKPLAIHTRDADDDTLAMLDGHAQGMKLILHCFSMASASTSASRIPTGTSRSPATSPTPRTRTLRAAMLKVPAGAPAGRDRRSLPVAAAGARQAATCRPTSCQTAQAIALERRVSYHDFDLEVEAASAAVFGW